MLRRSHKKSRGGCLQCRKRHVKCDESRPACRLCTMSDRNCSFISQAGSEKLSPSEISSQEPSISPGDNGGQDDVAMTGDNTPQTVSSRSNADSPVRPNGHINDHQDTSLDMAVDSNLNLNHMELLIHLTLHEEIFSFGASIGPYLSNITFGLKIGLESPYLLHQMLAFSARHLAFKRPERSAFHLHEAVTLQTRALTLFSAAGTEVNSSNCVAMLLFSSILGHHMLTDTFAKRSPGGLEAFLEHYLHCVEIHRGVYVIASTAWPLLMKSELEPILSWSSGFTSRSPKGNECQRIRELVDGSDGLAEAEKEACRGAIEYLQVGLDAVLAEDEEDEDKDSQGNQHQMIFSWTMLGAPKFMDLLTSRRPEALVLLGYYALLLYHGRDLWQVGDAGTYIIGLVVDYLGPEWDHWVEYPRARILANS